MLLALLVVLCGARAWEEVERFCIILKRADVLGSTHFVRIVVYKPGVNHLRGSVCGVLYLYLLLPVLIGLWNEP